MKDLNFDKLRRKLKKHNLATKGKKTEFFDRLKKPMDNRIPVSSTHTIETPGKGCVFSDTVYWQVLTAFPYHVMDPTKIQDSTLQIIQIW